MKRRGIAVAAAAAVAWGCVFQDASIETRSVKPAVPPREGGPGAGATAADGAPVGEAARPDAEPQGAVPTAAGSSDLGPAQAPEPVSLPRPAWTPPAPEIMSVRGLMMIAPKAVPGGAPDTSAIRLAFPVGTHAGLPGLAELAAAVVADLRSAAQDGRSLRSALRSVGGSLEVELTASTTAFQVVFPSSRWQEVVAILAERFARAPEAHEARPLVEEVRHRLVAEKTALYSADPLRSIVDRLTGRYGANVSDYLSQIAQRDAAEVTLFMRSRYRPQGAVLGLWIKDVSLFEVVFGVTRALYPWTEQAVAETGPPAPPVAPPPKGGLYWATRPGPAQLALVIPAPALQNSLAAELLVLEECLTQDGVAGRLGEVAEDLAQKEIAFEAWRTADDTYLVLRSTGHAERIMPLWEAAMQMRQSLLTHPPRGAELQTAVDRARLRVLDAIARPTGWLRVVTYLALNLGSANTLPTLLARLESPQRLQLQEAIKVATNGAWALAVVGEEPPAETAQTVEIIRDRTLAVRDAERLALPADIKRQEEHARELLERVTDAAGGRSRLTEVRGYRAACRSGTGAGPEAAVEIELGADGVLREKLTILATVIRTEIQGERGTEVSGDVRIDLPTDEARGRLREAQRHPLLLLAAAARGDARYRLASLFRAEGRELAVLERIDPVHVLSITVDTGSALIRAVEEREWDPAAGQVTMREDYDDYRPVDGVRVPFRCRRTSAVQGTTATTWWDSVELIR
jgi:hypothetical protein